MSQKQAQSLPASRRKDVKYIFDHYASGADSLHAGGLLRFLQMEQAEPGADDAMAENLIDKYEIDETERKSRTMTFPGFLRYMESRDCSVLNQEHTRVYQDMGRPLCHYFISSSHNTYLTADQLVGKSHLFAYESALRKGCRCLEIDCWDGPDLEPIVYHGYTLTSKILFRDVISTIAEHAFQVSPYPVILSLENHCHLPQQQVMAQYITTILGDRLLDAGLDLSSSAELPSPQKGKVKVAVELSNLVIYTKSVKFVSFSHSRESQRFYENTSLGEKKAHKLALKSGPEFVLHNARFISRIYPAGSRTLSSNYNPQEFWNMGSQLVALNFQSLGLPMDLNNARFRDNGGCGYVLKPHFLRSHEATFDPSALPPDLKPVQVLMKVISGSNLPISKAGKPIDPYVRVEITGVPADCRRIQSEPVKHNSLSPKWDASMNFTVGVPELALIRFTVRDHGLRPANDFMGQYTLPFTSMKKGYRWVPLLSREGHDLDPASLFIFVWHS
ncbi:1-phosphatidylinositol 4,5-bisphosphate phosphodiesterase zeta-1-like [Anguilla anguilla]|nr:1-phosphatidylinositol 4,5-bisphosphate phosphodiesterase zeta-1-like [Anguilla anguilla]XP_035280575.1 1-phosphatidylinositol 4,5-bisphosphate phosphodiesterase zeta-1-like [Anguilla anguilla]XP_035280576.1 1-phosphatidylinositol 4,5-bisphosphate phosphodiesterase zeta-1-like [Anguilla anguilla]